MSLTREFDFTNVTEPIKLSYWTWYDIEKDWDYLHLAASTDGENWEIITTPSGTDYSPSGHSYGWSYTGQSNGLDIGRSRSLAVCGSEGADPL